MTNIKLSQNDIILEYQVELILYNVQYQLKFKWHYDWYQVELKLHYDQHQIELKWNDLLSSWTKIT